MNILIINHYAGHPGIGMEYRPYYMAKQFQNMGHKVVIISSTNSHLRKKPACVPKDLTVENVDGIKYYWIKTPTYKGNISRLINIFTFVSKTYYYRKRISNLTKPDLVVASSTYPLDIYPSHKICQISKARLCYEVHDLWPLSPMELGGYTKYNPFIILLQHAENYAYRNSDQIVSLLPYTKTHMLDHGLSPEKFHYVPNGIDSEVWNQRDSIPPDYEDLIADIKSKNFVIVGYVGGFAVANCLDVLIECAHILKEKKFAFLLVGNGPEKDKIMAKAEQKSLGNIYFLKPISKNAIPTLLEKFDILYLGSPKSQLYRFGISPNKLFEYMMAGKPIVHSVDAPNIAVVESNCGIAVEPEDPDAVAMAVERISELSENQKLEMSSNAKKYVLENHDFKILAKKFLDIFN